MYYRRSLKERRQKRPKAVHKGQQQFTGQSFQVLADNPGQPKDGQMIESHPNSSSGYEQLVLRGDWDADSRDDLYASLGNKIESYHLENDELKYEAGNDTAKPITNVDAGKWSFNSSVFIWTQDYLLIRSADLSTVIKNITGTYAKDRAHYRQGIYSYDLLFNMTADTNEMTAFRNGNPLPSSNVKLQGSLVGLDIGNSSSSAFNATAANSTHILFQEWNKGWTHTWWLSDDWNDGNWNVFEIELYDWDGNDGAEAFWLGNKSVHVQNEKAKAIGEKLKEMDEFNKSFYGDDNSKLLLQNGKRVDALSTWTSTTQQFQ